MSAKLNLWNYLPIPFFLEIKVSMDVVEYFYTKLFGYNK